MNEELLNNAIQLVNREDWKFYPNMKVMNYNNLWETYDGFVVEQETILPKNFLPDLTDEYTNIIIQTRFKK